jgi:uncharacterized metal-binding protein
VRVDLAVRSSVELSAALASHDVDKLVCGGISREMRESLAAQDVVVVDNVACSVDEVLVALDSGSLCPGYGFTRPSAHTESHSGDSGPAAEVDATQPTLDCLDCPDRVCLAGRACRFLPPQATTPVPKEYSHLLEAATDIAREEERTLCRLAEVVYFCLEMRCRRVGLAFCVDLLEPSRILAGVLRRFFEVVPVWCKVGGVAEGDAETPTCNPLAQAEILNAARCDVNVVAGLCVGADCVFNQASQAPVTHLFVKDRSLANNPIGAVYSEYYLRESSNPAPGAFRLDAERSAAHRASSRASKHRETRS